MDDRGWKSQLIGEIFWDEESHIIMDIPLGVHRRADKLIWALTDHGRFIVKSAYYAILSIKRAKQGAVSNSRSSTWIDLWSLSIPKNVKNFL